MSNNVYFHRKKTSIPKNANFNSFTGKCKIVDILGRPVGSSYNGNQFKIVALEQKNYGCFILAIRRIAGCFAIVFSCGCACQSETISNLLKAKKNIYHAMPILKPEDKVYKGFLYKLRDNEDKVRGYLFGTVHLTDTKQVHLHKAAEKAFGKAKELVVEINAADIDEGSIAETSGVISIHQKIFDEHFFKGIDDRLEKKAAKRAMKIGSLESLKTQNKVLKELDKPMPSSIYKALYSYLLVSNEILLGFCKHGKKEQLDNWYSTYTTKTEIETICKERNPKMAKKIDKILQSSERSFIAIGSAHLIDFKSPTECDSVITLLEEKGWFVERVEME